MKEQPDTREQGKPEPTLTDQVTSILEEQIRSGAYPVNARLPTEKLMVAEYGVSRTVIREAISRLNSEGLVETRRGSGTVVLSPSDYETFRLGSNRDDPVQAVLHILELRQGIEAEMAALAAHRRSASQMAAIKRAFQAMDDAAANGRDGVKEDLDFHLAIAHATNNPHYPALLGMLTRALEDTIRITRGNAATATKLASQVRREHLAIFDAIAGLKKDSAREAAFSHMCNSAQRMRDAKESYWEGPGGKVARRLARAGLITR